MIILLLIMSMSVISVANYGVADFDNLEVQQVDLNDENSTGTDVLKADSFSESEIPEVVSLDNHLRLFAKVETLFLKKTAANFDDLYKYIPTCLEWKLTVETCQQNHILLCFSSNTVTV